MSGINRKITSLGTVTTFIREGTCSATMIKVLDGAFEDTMRGEERAAFPFAGGIVQHGYQCGMIWGAAMAAGARAYRLWGSGPTAEAGAVNASQRLVQTFHSQNRESNCMELTDIDSSSSALKMVYVFLLKGKSIACFRRAARYAPMAFDAIESALSEKPTSIPAPPVSCASMLARKMGASELHATMAAGLAGGIGLSGGACGALGAAIWLAAMNQPITSDLKPAWAMATIERFIKASDYRFECRAIAGRGFTDVADHAAYLLDGGCAKIIEALAAGS